LSPSEAAKLREGNVIVIFDKGLPPRVGTVISNTCGLRVRWNISPEYISQLTKQEISKVVLSAYGPRPGGRNRCKV